MIFGLQVNEAEALLTERTEQDVIALLLLLRIVGLDLAIVQPPQVWKSLWQDRCGNPKSKAFIPAGLWQANGSHADCAR